MATTKLTNPELFDLGSLNTALKLPSGTTAERPTSPSTGEWRYNTTTNLVEFWDGGAWRDLQSEDIPPIPSENFNVVTFTGDDTASKFIDVGFTPDFVWIKPMSVVSSHALYDSTRGDNNRLSSNSNGAQSTVPNEIVTNGFNIIGGTGYNDSTLGTMVAWCWKANGGTTSSNTDGSITSTVQVNNSAGISIVEYTGNGNTSQESFGHGLSSTPELIIQKSIDTLSTYGTNNWLVGGSAVGTAGSWLELNTTDAKQTDSNYWGNQLPSSTVVYISGSAERVHNESGKRFINYCFAEKAEYSKFGSYTGNGSTNGPIVNTGFEPAFVMIKSTSASGNWVMFDDKRSPLNPRNKILWANLSNAETDFVGTREVNFYSSGFQPVSSGSDDINDNGVAYIYIAFAADASAAPALADSFGVETYQGNGGTQSLAGYGFTPSMIWFKARTVAYDHGLYDSVRGGGSLIYPNLTQAASTVTNGVLSFDSSGVTIGANNKQNASDSTYVGWAWKANSIPTINTDGTIQSIVSANQASGFSVVKYTTTTGARVGHGLSQAPEIVLQKTLSSANSFFFANNLVSGTDDWEYLEMANDNAQTTNWTYYDGAEAPNATTFKDGWPNNTEMITYCFHSVDGFSKFGSYTGTGTSPGPTVTIGFQPDFLMIKSTSIAGAWFIMDSRRSPSNPRQLLLQPQSAAVEQNVGNAIDFNADNFQILDTNASRNASGQTYIYMAFKENPGTPAAIPAGEVAYLVVAAGGGAGGVGGGGGAGGLRTSYGNYTGGGIGAESNITLSAQTYTITIGAGGTASATGGAFNNDGNTGSNGTNSVFGTITSLGGGGGTGGNNQALNGGSGGGARFLANGYGQGQYGQGYDGATGDIGGGGGGAGGAGLSSTAGSCGANGGPGLNVPITGTTTYYAGGGAGGVSFASGCSATSGGIGGGGDAGANAGTANTGGGGGGGSWTNNANFTTQGGGNGGSGVVILRMNTSDYSGTTTGSPTVTTDGSETILTYTGSGTYVHS
jgi:hypothetical protein